MDLLHKQVSITDAQISDTFTKLEKALFQMKVNLARTSPTAKLCLSFIHYIQVVKMFIRGERSADWYLHQVSTLQMLNLFAANGHTHYAKSARLYLQLMNELSKTQP